MRFNFSVHLSKISEITLIATLMLNHKIHTLLMIHISIYRSGSEHPPPPPPPPPLGPGVKPLSWRFSAARRYTIKCNITAAPQAKKEHFFLPIYDKYFY